MRRVVVALTYLLFSTIAVAWNPVSGQTFKRRRPPNEEARPARRPLVEDAKAPVARSTLSDLYRDPLPPGAVARLGTVRDNIGFISSDIVLSPDGKSVIATSGFFAIPLRLWDVATCHIVREFPELDSRNSGAVSVASVAFSPDGRTLAAATNVEVTLRDIETGQWVRKARIQVPEDSDMNSIHSIAFTSDGKTFATGGDDGVRLWNAATGVLRRHFKGHIGGIREIAIAPDGKTLASGGQDGTTLIWTLTDTAGE